MVPLDSLGLQERRAPVVVEDIFAHTQLLAAPVFDSDNEKTRPNLKVQDGCNNRCSFCVIPYVRGRSRSLPLAEVLQNVDQLVANGYQELVLSGINLGRWGRDLAELVIASSIFCRPFWSAQACPCCASVRWNPWTGATS